MQGNREGAKSEFRQELKYHPTNGLARMQIDRMEKAPPTVAFVYKIYPEPENQLVKNDH